MRELVAKRGSQLSSALVKQKACMEPAKGSLVKWSWSDFWCDFVEVNAVYLLLRSALFQHDILRRALLALEAAISTCDAAQVPHTGGVAAAS